MKTSILVLSFLIMTSQMYLAQNSNVEQDIIKLSKGKWQWMSDKNVDTLDNLFHKKICICPHGRGLGQRTRT